jgi:hypothetical protein
MWSDSFLPHNNLAEDVARRRQGRPSVAAARTRQTKVAWSPQLEYTDVRPLNARNPGKIVAEPFGLPEVPATVA